MIECSLECFEGPLDRGENWITEILSFFTVQGAQKKFKPNFGSFSVKWLWFYLKFVFKFETLLKLSV